MKSRDITFGFVILLVVAGTLAGAAAGGEIEAFVREIIKDARTDSERSTLLSKAVSLAEDNKKLKIALLEKALQYGIKSLRTTNDCERFRIFVPMAAKDLSKLPVEACRNLGDWYFKELSKSEAVVVV